MGVQKLLRGHDVSASLRHLQMAPEPNYFKTAGKYRPTVPRSVARPIPLHCMRMLGMKYNLAISRGLVGHVCCALSDCLRFTGDCIGLACCGRSVVRA